VEPAEGTITLVNGVVQGASPLTFTAKGTTDKGKVQTLTPTWTLDNVKLVAVDSKGTVTTSGALGGTATLTATHATLTATAKVTVKIITSVTPADGSIPPADQQTLLGASAPDASVRLSYPYDRTVFPPGVLAPSLMWQGAAGDDTYLAQVSSPFGAIEVFTKAPEQRLPLPEAAWSGLLRDAAGTALQVKVSRLSQGQATVVAQQTWPVASGPLRGTVYYWANSIGRVMRIKPGSTAPDDFLKDTLQAAGLDPTKCSTCHTVSANGTTLLLGGGEEADDSKASVFDLSTNQVSRTYDQGYGRAWAMPALSPDGKYAVLNDASQLPGGPGKGGGLFDVGTAAKVPGTSLDADPLWMPAFSPDGTRLVYVDRTSRALGALDYNQSLLPGDPFSNKRELVPEAGPSNNAGGIAFPYPSPDGKWAIYHRGPLDTRAVLVPNTQQLQPADMFLASLDSPGVEIPLDALNGTGYDFVAGDRDRHFNFEPTFAPLPAGGYFWAIFTSRRTYGNQLTGSPLGGGEGQGVKQLWMAAIDLHPTPGQDPSHPAFLLQGQDLATLNMRAFWAFDPCKPDGAGCEFGSDCCNGSCEPDNGTLVCKKSDTVPACVQTGNKCTKTSDCCGAASGSECINGFCSDPPIIIQ
ncbi:MAG: hypothetical protein EOO75_07955, partial [Myxococcales bacterium]